MSMKFKTVLFTTDLSDLSWKAFDTALSIAEKFHGEIKILNIVEPSVICMATPVGGGFVGDYKAVEDGMQKAASATLNERLERLSPSVPIEAIVASSLDPPDEICSQAARLKTDLIVMATHGRTGLSHVFLGSTAEKVVRKSPVPVLTVRASSMGDSTTQDW